MNRQKKINVLFGLIMGFSSFTYAQALLEVKINGDNPDHIFYTVEIPQVPIKDLQNDWKDYVGKNSKGKDSQNLNEFVQRDVVNTNISPTPFDVHATFIQVTEGTSLKVALEEDNQPFQTNDENKRTISKFIHDFAVNEYKKEVTSELKREREKLSVLEDQAATMNKHEDKSLKNIGNNDRSNVKSEDAISTNNSDIQASGGKIEDQKGMVDKTAADENANRGANKTLDQLEDDKKGMQKDNEKQLRKIEQRNENTREEERNIAAGKENRSSLMKQIELQKEVVLNVQNKLDAIN